MQLKTEALDSLDATRRFFDRTLRCLDEGDSQMRATNETWSVAAHVAHVAEVIDWFREGVFDDNWRMDFEASQARTAGTTSLAAARKWLDEAWDRLRARVESSSDEELGAAMPDNPILQTRPRFHIVASLADHTGHHRGAIAVLARLAGKTPDMPYAED